MHKPSGPVFLYVIILFSPHDVGTGNWVLEVPGSKLDSIFPDENLGFQSFIKRCRILAIF